MSFMISIKTSLVQIIVGSLTSIMPNSPAVKYEIKQLHIK